MTFKTKLCRASFALAVISTWVCGYATAQTSIVALVNNTPITSTEVSERRAVVRLTKKKEITQKQALEEIIDQHLLLAEAKKRTIGISDEEVQKRFEAVGAGSKLSADQLGKALSQAGASSRAFKAEIRDGLLRRKIGSMLSRLATGISEKEIAAGITAKKSDGDTLSYRYRMQQIVFVTPKGASPGQINQRRQEAENFRRRIQNCEQAVSLVKELRDVAAKPEVMRISSQLSSQFRDQIATLKVGQSTKAEPGELGIELIVLCDKQETVDDSALRNEVQAELVKEQSSAEIEKFIADSRKRAMIIYR
jgi:peptidyl-prolyl cis-trans isomerase SurA